MAPQSLAMNFDQQFIEYHRVEFIFGSQGYNLNLIVSGSLDDATNET